MFSTPSLTTFLFVASESTNGKAELRQECLPERQEFMHVENSRDADGLTLCLARLACTPCKASSSLNLKRSVTRLFLDLPHNVILFAPAPVIKRCLSFARHPSDLTQVLAALALEGVYCILPFAQVKAFEAALLPGPLLHGQNSDPDGSGHVVVRRHGDRFRRPLFRRQRQRLY